MLFLFNFYRGEKKRATRRKRARHFFVVNLSKSRMHLGPLGRAVWIFLMDLPLRCFKIHAALLASPRSELHNSTYNTLKSIDALLKRTRGNFFPRYFKKFKTDVRLVCGISCRVFHRDNDLFSYIYKPASVSYVLLVHIYWYSTPYNTRIVCRCMVAAGCSSWIILPQNFFFSAYSA